MKEKKYLFIDFEFNKTKHKYLNVESGSFMTTEDMETFGPMNSFWLHKDSDLQEEMFYELKGYMEQGYTFVCYQAEAEARSILSLIKPEEPLDLPLWQYNWIDLWIEYRHLQNQNNKLKYGYQLIDGKVKKTFPPKPKWERKDGEKGSQEPQDGMAAACYKLLGVQVDTERKNRVRDLIISAPEEFTEEEQEEIIQYNESDIEYLPQLLKAVVNEYRERLSRKERKTLLKEMLWRGEYGVRTAYMVTEGYPYDHERTSNFSDSVRLILNDLCRDINSQFHFKPFQWDKKNFKFKWKQKGTRGYLKETYPHLIDKWKLTDTGQLGLSLEAFTHHFDFKHSYPRGNFGAQIVRFLKTKQSLNGFTPSGKGKSFWDYTGPDERVRPFFNIYRSQSARSQPPSTGYLFLKAAWMRALCVPPKGKVMIGADWSSQEFFIGALMSGDKNMIRAYLSGDPYLWFAKEAGSVPKEGTREEYETLRGAFKATTLAEMYMMGIESLANKITNDTGREYTIEEAADLDSLFREVFFDFCEWRMEQVERNKIDGKLKSFDGWYMWGDNPNFRSIANFPIQAAGSSIMRRAVAMAQDEGLSIVKTLHDALYALVDIDSVEESIEVLVDCMNRAFKFYLPESQKKIANCRSDADAWSPELSNCNWFTKNLKVPVKQQSLYVDKRSKEDYEKFKKYFDINHGLEWL